MSVFDFEAKRKRRMDLIDSLTPEMRAVINDYGFNVVNTLIGFGIEKPKHIKHIVETILDEFSPSRGTFSRQGPASKLANVESAEKQ